MNAASLRTSVPTFQHCRPVGTATRNAPAETDNRPDLITHDHPGTDFVTGARPAFLPSVTRRTESRNCSNCDRTIGADEAVCFWSDSLPDEPRCEQCVTASLRRRDERDFARTQRPELDVDSDSYDPFGGVIRAWVFRPRACDVCGQPQRGGGDKHHAFCSEECKALLPRVIYARKRDSEIPDFTCAACSKSIAGTIVFDFHSSMALTNTGPRYYCESCFIIVETERARENHQRYPNVFPDTDSTGWSPFRAYKFDAHPCACGRSIRRVSGIPYCSDRCEIELRNARRRVTHESQQCDTCSSDFTPNRADSRYCSNKCRQRAYRARAKPPSEEEPSDAVRKSNRPKTTPTREM